MASNKYFEKNRTLKKVKQRTQEKGVWEKCSMFVWATEERARETWYKKEKYEEIRGSGTGRSKRVLGGSHEMGVDAKAKLESEEGV